VTIGRGRPWGEPWSGSDEVVAVTGDAEVAHLAHQAYQAHQAGSVGAEPPALAPSSGDLLRTIGLDGPRPWDQRHRYPVDLALAQLTRVGGESEVVPFVAHLTVRNRRLDGLGPGLSVAVMNAAWLGDLRLGPRAHPNDGLLDITEGTVGLTQRREANRRARTGSHLPHPRLRTGRSSTWVRHFERPVPVWLDGARRGRCSSIRVEVVPDALVIVA
jgi:hypothetical protein